MTTKQKILSAASILLMKNGISSTSLAEIAKAVGISKGTLFYHYASKEKLVLDITTQERKQFSELFIKAAKKGFDRDVFAKLVSNIVDSPSAKLHLLLLMESGASDNPIAETLREQLDETSAIVTEGVSKMLDIEKHDTQIGRSIMALIHGVMIQKMVSIESIDSYQIVDMLLASTLALVKAKRE
jgi:AcrR family transcriptional regulator